MFSQSHLTDIYEMAKPDERSIMTYVAAFYHAFSGNDKVVLFCFLSFCFDFSENLHGSPVLVIAGCTFKTLNCISGNLC